MRNDGVEVKILILGNIARASVISFEIEVGASALMVVVVKWRTVQIAIYSADVESQI